MKNILILKAALLLSIGMVNFEARAWIDPAICSDPATYNVDCARDDMASNASLWEIFTRKYDDTVSRLESRVQKRARIRSRIRQEDNAREEALLRKTYKKLNARLKVLRRDRFNYEKYILIYQTNIANLLRSYPSTYTELPDNYEEREF